jgi:hypothetical protein
VFNIGHTDVDSNNSSLTLLLMVCYLCIFHSFHVEQVCAFFHVVYQCIYLTFYNPVCCKYDVIFHPGYFYT